jgi:hypothetical protein
MSDRDDPAIYIGEDLFEQDEPEVGVDICAHGVSYSDECEECDEEEDSE